MKTIKEVFTLALAVRPWDDAQEFINTIRRNQIVWCWGAEKWTIFNNAQKEKMAICFKSNGYLHKGLVFVVVNGSDTFDIYLTTLERKIKKVQKDVHLEDFIEIVDSLIERK